MSRQRFPRQSAASSDGAATSSANNVATPGAASSGALNTVTSDLSSVTDLTSVLPSVSSPASSTVDSSIASSSQTTTSSSTETTSTSPSISSSQPSSSAVPSTRSLTPTSSSSPIPLSTTSSTTLPPSSVPPPTTTITQLPTTSSSSQGILTTITSSFTTFVNGSQIPTQTSFPSTIPAPSSSSSSNRAAIIGGSAAGGTALLVLLLTLAFCARRKRFKRLSFLDAITLRRKQLRSRTDLLGEDLADVDLRRPPGRYTDYDTPWDARDSSDRALIAPRGASEAPHGTGRSRWSESGSAFKDEIWAPPHEGTRLMDPLANRDDPDLDLARIVDDVMGPSSTTRHFSDRSVSSMYRDSVAGSDGAVHSRTVSNASNAALLEAAGLGGTTGAGPLSLSTAPVRSSPLAQPVTQPGSVEHQGGNAS